MLLTIKDESLTGTVLHEFTLLVDRQQLTVREIITARVAAEVADYNRQQPDVFRGLVRPSEAEAHLNGYRLRKNHRDIDAEEQTYVALAAFQQRAFLLLVDDRQLVELDQQVRPDAATTVSLVRLTPLIGG